MNQRNVAASVRARLLNKARAEQLDFNLLLTRYALERMLYRLSVSEQRGQFLFFLKKPQGLVQEKMSGAGPFGTHAECLQKSGAVGGHAQTGQIPAQAGQSPDQHALVQGQRCGIQLHSHV